MFKKVAILGLFLVGALWRIWNIWLPSYWIDEAFSINVAQTEPWLRSPLYHFVLAAWGNLLSWQPFTLRMLSVLFGLATCYVIWKLATHWFGTVVGYLSLGLMLFSTLEIAWSRQVRMYSLFQLCVWLTVLFYAKRQWLWCGVFAVLTCFTHELGIMVLGVVGILWLWERGFTKLTVIVASSSVGIAAVVMPWLGYPSVNYITHYLYFFGTHFLGAILLTIVAVWVSAKRLASGVWLVLVWWLAICSLVIPLLHYRYFFVVYPALLILASVGMVHLWKRSYLWRLILAVAITVMLLQSELTIQPHTFYPLESDPPTAPFGYKSITPQPNFKGVYDYLNGQQGIMEVYTPYPEVHALYSHLQYHALPINLTEAPDQTESVVLPEHGIAILDEFAKQRLPQEVVSKITGGQKMMFDPTPLPYSSIAVYQW